MLNIQFINLLRKLNFKFIVEIIEFRKKNVKILKLKKENTKLK